MNHHLRSHPLSLIVTALALIALPLQAADAPTFSDPFTADAKVPVRRAMRGDWQIADGVAKCKQDDALYKKYKNHGPIIFYDLPTTDSTIRYEFKPQGCKAVVFTLNAQKGHVFRFATIAGSTTFRAFPPDGEKKSILSGAKKEWKLKEGEWTSVEVKMEGKKATVKFGDHEAFVIEHDTYAKAKTNLSVGFSFGTLSLKGVEVTQ